MNKYLLRLTLALTWLLLGPAAYAQSTWQHLYGSNRHEDCQRLMPLPGGGYLLAGSSETSRATSTNLYLIRTDEQGRQLWTREYPFTNAEQLAVVTSCANPTGQVLLVAQTRKTTADGYQETTGLLLLLQPDGRVAWERRTEPARTWVRPYGGVASDSTGNFWVALNNADGGALQLLSPTGQELCSLPLPQPGFIQGLFPSPSGLLAYEVRQRVEAALIPVSATGT